MINNDGDDAETDKDDTDGGHCDDDDDSGEDMM